MNAGKYCRQGTECTDNTQCSTRGANCLTGAKPVKCSDCPTDYHAECQFGLFTGCCTCVANPPTVTVTGTVG